MAEVEVREAERRSRPNLNGRHPSANRMSEKLQQRMRVTTVGGASRTSFSTQVITPPTEKEDWRTIDLDRGLLETMAPKDLIRFLAAVSPEYSRALWDIMRNANAGFSWDVVSYDTGETTDDGRLETQLFLDHLADRHGSVSQLWNVMLNNLATRGGILAECVLDRGGRVPIDIAVPDAATVRFRPKKDADYGEVWELGQHDTGEPGQFRSLDGVITVRYLAHDRMPDSPYGRSPLDALLFPALFMLGVFRDLRRVIHQQGFPQRDVTIDTEKLMAAIPRNEDLLEGEEPTQADLDTWVAQALEFGGDQFDNIDPDATIVHTDVYKVLFAQAAVGGGALAHLGDVIESLERSVVRGAKSHPLLMGLTEGASEANANRQWEVFAKGIKSFQHPLESVISEMLTIALEAQGIVARVIVKFAEVRVSEEYRDAQSMQLKLMNAEQMERLGYKTHDEASFYAVGHKARTASLAATTEPEPTPTTLADESPANEEDDTAEPEMPANGETDELRWVRDAADITFARAWPMVEARMKRDLTRFVPSGATAGFAPVDEPTTTSRSDERTAAAEFDADLPEYEGLLDATVADEDAE